jgi:hypothetical protein
LQVVDILTDSESDGDTPVKAPAKALPKKPKKYVPELAVKVERASGVLPRMRLDLRTVDQGGKGQAVAPISVAPTGNLGGNSG